MKFFGLHVWPQLPVGTVGLKKGHLMAASDHFLVHIHGKSTHGAEPHNGIDAIVAAANWIVNVESWWLVRRIQWKISYAPSG